MIEIKLRVLTSAWLPDKSKLNVRQNLMSCCDNFQFVFQKIYSHVENDIHDIQMSGCVGVDAEMEGHVVVELKLWLM